MEYSTLIVSLLILAETTYLTMNTGIKKAGSKNNRLIFVDTSVLIDGRILPLAKAGFIGRKLMIPRSVVGELQLLADQADPDKRLRARQGLDIISELQALSNVDVDIFHDDRQASEGVDTRLLKLAKKYHGAICTIDFNLNKVAKTESIEVLNINDLAMNLRMAYLPGEVANIHLVQKGQESRQAVGYLADGTMVVVEKAVNKIGQNVDVRFTRGLQTEAGKMMFAELLGAKNENSNKQKPTTNNYTKRNKDDGRNKKPYNAQKPVSKKYSPKKQGPVRDEQRLVDLINNQ